MKKCFSLGLLLAFLAWFILPAAFAADTGVIHPLSTDMRAIYGATDYIILTEADLDASTSTSIAKTVTYSVPSNTWVQFVGAEVVTPITGSAATNQVIGNVTWSFGTADSATAFLNASGCGTNTTSWWTQGLPSVTVSTATNFASTATVAHGTAYAAGTNLMATITPASGQALSWSQRGELIIYLRKFAPSQRR